MQCGLDVVLGEVPKTSRTAQKSLSVPGGLQSSLSPGLRMSSILRIILTTWVANKICCFLPIRVSTTCCCFMSVGAKKGISNTLGLALTLQGKYCDCITLSSLPLVFLCRQSMPRKGLFSLTCLALTSVMVWIGFSPLFSANAIGITSRASANDLMAYCSNDGHWRRGRAGNKKKKKKDCQGSKRKLHLNSQQSFSKKVQNKCLYALKKEYHNYFSFIHTPSAGLTLSAAWLTARAHAISEAPPPYTTRLSLTRLRITHRASWRARLASSMI